MLPFFKPGDIIYFEPIPINSVRVGDVIVFKKEAGHLFAHRIIKVVKERDEIKLLAKADHRITCDPILTQKEMVGKVIRIGNRDLTSATQRFLGSLIARVSFFEARLYLWIYKNPLNYLRHKLEKKGWFPKVKLLSWNLTPLRFVGLVVKLFQSSRTPE